MRLCPKCDKTAVVEHGYCGICRKFTLAPLANRRTPDNQPRWPHWWRKTATWIVCLALLAHPLAGQSQSVRNPGKGEPQCLECMVILYVVCIGAVGFYGWMCEPTYLPPAPRPPRTYAQALATFSTNSFFNPPQLGLQFTMLCNIGADGSLSLEPAVMGQWLTADMFTNTPTVAIGWTNGVLSITEPGQHTRTIVLERSTDLQSWSPIATNVWSARFEQVTEIDTDAPQDMAFYRVR